MDRKQEILGELNHLADIEMFGDLTSEQQKRKEELGFEFGRICEEEIMEQAEKRQEVSREMKQRRGRGKP